MAPKTHWTLGMYQYGYVRNDNNEPHKTIQDERGLIRKNYFNDVMREVMDDFNKLLEYDD